MTKEKQFIAAPIKEAVMKREDEYSDHGPIKFTNYSVNMQHVIYYRKEFENLPVIGLVYTIRFYTPNNQDVVWWFGQDHLAKDKRDWTFNWIESEFSREIPVPGFDNPYGI